MVRYAREDDSLSFGRMTMALLFGAVSLVGVSIAQIDELSPRMKAIGVSVWLTGALAAGLILSW